MHATARWISREIAAVHAADVDDQARFPSEAIAALRSHRLLGAAVPVELGGDGLDLDDIATITTELARGCSSTAMIFAMHQIQVFCLLRHGRNPALLDFQRRLAGEQLLLASATTEIGRGGDVRASSCAIEECPDGGVQLEKTAPVISYGKAADAVLATARRTPDSTPEDQVLMLCVQGGDSAAQLTQISDWDSLGMRGTCSCGFKLVATGPDSYVLDDGFELISSATMLPVSHLLWAAVWLGIAQQATDAAHRFVRAEAHKRVGTVPPAALRLAEATVSLQQLQESVRSLLRRYVAYGGDLDAPADLRFVTAMNALKVSSSTLVIDVVSQALVICGIAGYRNDSQFSVARQLRDAFGAVVMINNDRILHNNAQLLLGVRDI